MKNRKERQFPLFVDIGGWRTLVVGGGKIAARRVRTLLEFGADITVVALDFVPELLQIKDDGRIRCETRGYQPEDLKDVQMALAATNDSALNASIARECRERGILVNICSDQKLCDFQFPSVVIKEELTVGINAAGNNHKKVKAARQCIESCMGGEHIYE